MTREIKFRAWDKEAKAYVGDVRLGFSLYEIALSPFEHADKLKDLEFEQYTGLKDKNGKEIYEGDIVKYLSYRKNYIGQVVFDFVDDSEGYYIEKHYGWGIYRDDYNTSLGDYADGNMRCELVEVISTVHENPELFGGEE